MKILLIYPYWLEERINTEDVVVPPIGMYYVGAVLKENNYDVEILNWCKINETPEKISEILIEKKPDVIGFSILQANRWGGIEIARIAKQIDPEVKIVFGGVSATFLWKHFLTHFPEIDFVVMGEGEYTFLNLVRWLEKGEDEHIGNIKGIAFRKEGKVVRTKPPEYIRDLDQLPVPAKYFEYQHLSLTRGCPGKCTFCGSPKFWGHKVRFHSVDYFVEELELLYKKGIHFFYFSDDTFSVNKKRVIEICKKILEKNLRIAWNAISRVNYMSEEVLSWMRRAGCIQISYGIESGSEKIRAYLNKKITTREIENTFADTLKYSILPRAYFIYGSPGETSETIQESIDLIKRINPLVIHSFVLSLFPGTALYSEYKKKFNVSEDIWLNRIEDIKYFETDAKLSREDVISFGKRLRTTYYEFLPSIVDAIEFIDKKEFYPMHADFCSRLGMTFDHGDYSLNEEIKGKDKIAEKLYSKALKYHPDPRAFLGLGILHQKKRAYHESINILSKGVEYFPENEPLNLCLGISHMNLGAFETALSFFLKFQHSRQCLGFIVNCYHELNDFEKASAYQQKLESIV
ncbi:MAG: cobalamin-dependent protein [Deltaproteobacteria bacterium]|nr:cobalamin-dependent protein [Deltaproteobacteria bacterium]MBW1958348.1 cobalamin-dependent protein [Deltaproteobacteria bacterium]MBW2014930.1 cobalamin-dependent protein [Deltaproteobacteria bacterium]MBW2089541.1 cobalamin-dependent protein [Deltaproteobacteria bacterium]MBW2321365.1 cobalamin-dependent protein [Deltaproteobacteria bacterium]